MHPPASRGRSDSEALLDPRGSLLVPCPENTVKELEERPSMANNYNDFDAFFVRNLITEKNYFIFIFIQ